MRGRVMTLRAAAKLGMREGKAQRPAGFKRWHFSPAVIPRAVRAFYLYGFHFKDDRDHPQRIVDFGGSRRTEKISGDEQPESLSVTVNKFAGNAGVVPTFSLKILNVKQSPRSPGRRRLVEL